MCTTIIESGLDIARANTMLVHHAERLGMAQLYQLRGRIGRSSERAYCYLLVAPGAQMTREAAQRVATIQRFSELGSGLAIARQDMAIRGVGALLGAEQSGQINAVGFDTYMSMLNEAMAIVRGEKVAGQQDREFELKVQIDARIPETWIPDASLRLQLYKALAGADALEQIYDVAREATDRFGKLPPEVDRLVQLMVLRYEARALGFVGLGMTETSISFSLGEQVMAPEPLMAFLARPTNMYRLTPDMQLVRPRNPGEGLESALQSLREIKNFATNVTPSGGD